MTDQQVDAPDAIAALGLPAPDQIGFVVRDLDRAVAFYEPLFGPLRKVDYGENSASYRGAEPTPYNLKFAFGRAGGMEIELIEWVSGDTPHRDFLDRGCEGMHHLRYRVDQLETWGRRLETFGYVPVWYDRMSPEVAYCYFEREGDPLIVELLEFPETADPLDGI